MEWLLILLLILLLITGYLLLAPFYLEVDSRSGLCRVRFHRLVSVWLTIEENSLMLHLRIMGWKKRLDLLEPKEESKVTPAKVKTQSKRPRIPFRKAWAVLRSFKLNQCLLSFDWGDTRTNALLFPWFYLAGRISGQPIGINFLNEQAIILEVENNLFRMIRAYLTA
jgi:hypothetical protein